MKFFFLRSMIGFSIALKRLINEIQSNNLNIKPAEYLHFILADLRAKKKNKLIIIKVIKNM